MLYHANPLRCKGRATYALFVALLLLFELTLRRHRLHASQQRTAQYHKRRKSRPTTKRRCMRCAENTGTNRRTRLGATARGTRRLRADERTRRKEEKRDSICATRQHKATSSRRFSSEPAAAGCGCARGFYAGRPDCHLPWSYTVAPRLTLCLRIEFCRVCLVTTTCSASDGSVSAGGQAFRWRTGQLIARLCSLLCFGVCWGSVNANAGLLTNYEVLELLRAPHLARYVRPRDPTCPCAHTRAAP